MDPTLLAAIVTLLILGVFIAFRTVTVRKVRHGEISSLPDRVVNPRLFAHLKSIKFWQLKVEAPSKACTWAQQSSGRRFPTDKAVPVPIAGCGKNCRCNYLPMADGRRALRRNEPGLTIEYDPKNTDRRAPRGRRKEDNWSGGGGQR
jgi:hypothetical protein